MDDNAKGDSGCVAIQQLYEDIRSDWTGGHNQEKSAKNGLDRILQLVCCSLSCIQMFIYHITMVATMLWS